VLLTKAEEEVPAETAGTVTAAQVDEKVDDELSVREHWRLPDS
jgi:hypothetical protein